MLDVVEYDSEPIFTSSKYKTNLFENLGIRKPKKFSVHAHIY